MKELPRKVLVRRDAGRQDAGLAEDHKGEDTNGRQTYGNIPPCLNTLPRGQQPCSDVGRLPSEPRGASLTAAITGENRSPMYPIPGWDSAARGWGQSHRLHGSVECLG